MTRWLSLWLLSSRGFWVDLGRAAVVLDEETFTH